MIDSLAIAGYRSLRDVKLRLGRLTVVTGGNGSGKSSLYRALRLLAEVAQGRIVQALAAEGGMASARWAGPETISAAMRRGEVPVQGTARSGPIRLLLGFGGEDYGYAIDLGQPPIANSAPTAFRLDPQIAVEALWTGRVLKPASVFAERRGPAVRVRDEAGRWMSLGGPSLTPFDSMMTHYGDPRDMAELLGLRLRMASWRFYDRLRTDSAAPARQPLPPSFTPALPGDGSGLSAALQTIREVGDADALADAIADAFPGAWLTDDAEPANARMLSFNQLGLRRPLSAAELSGGTLRYLMLTAALLSPRPPPLLVLNEPETGLHPDLLPPLARLIQRAAETAQILIVTHSDPLANALDNATAIHLHKELGETLVEQEESVLLWKWPER